MQPNNQPTGGIFIALGSNLGPRETHILSALRELDASGAVAVLHISRLHETEAVGGPAGQPRYLNAAAELHSDLAPRPLLELLLLIESHHGRERGVRNGPRTLDLDLLLYRNVVLHEPGLIVPHPRMWERTFVMTPLRAVCRDEAYLARMQSVDPRSAVRCAGSGSGPSAKPKHGQCA